jgi:hypothetical protein
VGLLEKRALRILKNLPKRLVATVRHQADVEVDSLMNSALKAMKVLSRSPSVSDKTMVQAWDIYLKLQKMSGKVAHKFLDNEHNKPVRVESSSVRAGIKGQDWNQFYNTGGKPFDQYYRHGGNWRYGTRIWKSAKKTLLNTLTSRKLREK